MARSRPATPHKCQTDPIVEGDYGIPHQIATHGLARGDQPTESGGRSMALAWMEQPRIVVFGTTRERSRGVEDDSRGRKEHESRRLFVARKKNSISVYINDLEGTSGDRTPIYILQMGLYPTERNATAGSDMLTLTSDDGLRLARCQARRGMNSVRQPTSHAISARNS